jgi:hypothetical protein
MSASFQKVVKRNDYERLRWWLKGPLSPGCPYNPYDPHAMFDDEMGTGYDLPLCAYHNRDKSQLRG